MLGYFDYMLGFEWLCSESYYKFKEIENYNETAPLGNQREDMSLRPLFRGKKIFSYNLRCCTRIFSPKKSRLSHHLVRLMKSKAVDGKAFTFSLQGRLSEFFRTMALKTLKNPYHLQTDAKTFLERGRKLICEKKNRKLRI